MLKAGWKRAFFGLTLAAVCLLIAFPILWILLTSLRPASEVFYVHRGTQFTLGNYLEVLGKPELKRAFFNSGMIATLATILSIQVTITSGYMLSRFRGKMANAWFGLIYLFRAIPYIAWVLPLYVVEQSVGLLDSYWVCCFA
jgi:multiple sugar transport system permease protein